MSTYSTIMYERRGSQARITLNRPEVRNAINYDMEQDVKQALRALQRHHQQLVENNVIARLVTTRKSVNQTTSDE